MLFIGLVLAFMLYICLYFMWEAAQPHLGRAAGVMATINRMLFTPEHAAFIILRNLMLVVLVYLVADFFFSSAKRAIRRRNEPPPIVPRHKPRDPVDQDEIF